MIKSKLFRFHSFPSGNVPFPAKNIFIALALVVLPLIINGCDASIGPFEEKQNGFTGKVIDTEGNPVPGVDVYYIYMNYNGDWGLNKAGFLTRIDDVTDTLDWKLYQNFPNPFSEATFIRFALPIDCTVDFSIVEKATGETKLILEDTLLYYGLYQFYFDNLLEKYNLHNGIYRFGITAKVNGKTVFSDEKEFCLVQTDKNPNYVTDTQGICKFRYKYAYVGVTIPVTYSNPDYYSELILTNEQFIVLKKEGFKTKLIPVSLYPSVENYQEIILVREGE